MCVEKDNSSVAVGTNELRGVYSDVARGSATRLAETQRAAGKALVRDPARLLRCDVRLHWALLEPSSPSRAEDDQLAKPL